MHRCSKIVPRLAFNTHYRLTSNKLNNHTNVALSSVSYAWDTNFINLSMLTDCFMGCTSLLFPLLLWLLSCSEYLQASRCWFSKPPGITAPFVRTQLFPIETSSVDIPSTLCDPRMFSNIFRISIFIFEYFLGNWSGEL